MQSSAAAPCKMALKTLIYIFFTCSRAVWYFNLLLKKLGENASFPFEFQGQPHSGDVVYGVTDSVQLLRGEHVPEEVSQQSGSGAERRLAGVVEQSDRGVHAPPASRGQSGAERSRHAVLCAQTHFVPAHDDAPAGAAQPPRLPRVEHAGHARQRQRARRGVSKT